MVETGWRPMRKRLPNRLMSFLDMHLTTGHHYNASLASLDAFIAALEGLGGKQLRKRFKHELRLRYEPLEAHLDALGCGVALFGLATLKERHHGGLWSPEKLRDQVRELRTRVKDHFGATYLLTLSHQEADLWRGRRPFSGDVWCYFGNAQVDYEAAARCLAVGCFTACVFHIVRCLEVVLVGFCSHLGVPSRPSDQRTWGNHLNDIRDRIERMKGDVGVAAGDLAFYQRSHDQLSRLKVPLRNALMHNGPAYAESQALDIFALLDTIMDGFIEHGHGVSASWSKA